MKWPRRRSARRSTEPDTTDPTPPALDPERVFDALRAHDVSYVTIGGIAVQAHGHPRTTQDVDILAEPSRQNLEHLARALAALDARLFGVDANLLGVDPTDPSHLAAGANFTLITNAGRLDVWTDPAELKGAAPWAEIAERAETTTDGRVRIVGLDDLLAMKQAAGRERDLSDIAALTHRAPDVGPETEGEPEQSPRPGPGIGL